MGKPSSGWQPPEALVVRLECLPSGDYVSLDVYEAGRALLPVIEDGVFATDGTRGAYALENVRRLCSLLMHSPEMFRLLEAWASADATTLRHLQPKRQAQELIAAIRRGELGDR